ncbi:GTPase [Nocardioides dongxiaopingii]|uniref:GTPase n=1 Tax=Nocardioides sp. S-1144 TaxID=2582905 RepID=UPI001652B110|nr:GTPase [Nocardioides sp. S-1144]
MTSLLEGARQLVTRGTDIGARIEGLEQAATAARGRLDDDVVDVASTTSARAAGRLRLSAQHTVVAIAGATGSGKSSTFNALTGLELSSTGVRRPTTSWATACVWGRAGAAELLEWLGIPPRHQTMRDSMLDVGKADRDLEGVVLMDLPDHDSTEVSHHLEVDRLVLLADLLVWVLDPQKYADAAIHDRYLAPLRGHAGVMVVVLNHIDTIPADRRQSMVDDVRRLLDLDGLQSVPIYAVSARHDIGIDELRAEIASRVAAKKLTVGRIEADLRSAAEAMDAATGPAAPRELTAARVRELDDAVAEAAGVPVVVDAVERSTRQRARRATTWPVLAPFSRLGSDPAARLELDLGDAAGELSGAARSTPRATTVQRARLDAEVRALADDASDGLGAPWVAAVQGAATSRLPELGDRLDRDLGAADLGLGKLPGWVTAVRVLQWLLLLAAVAGAVWTGVLAVGGTLTDDANLLAGVPLPVLLLVGGLVLGVLLAVLCRFRAATLARDRAGDADERLRDAVHAAVDELVATPVATELAAYSTVRTHLDAVLDDPAPTA